MARPHVFTSDTTLYHPSEGARIFPAGETDPGDAWHDSPGGAPADKGTTKQAMKDLIAAQDQMDALGAQLVAKDHDLAVIGAQRDEAAGKVADLEQRAIAAEKAAADAIEGATELRRERDQARGDFQRVSDQFTEARARVAELEPEAAKVPDLSAQLETANQTIADLNGQIASLTADLDKATAPTPKAKKGAATEDVPENPAESGAEPASGA